MPGAASRGPGAGRRLRAGGRGRGAHRSGRGDAHGARPRAGSDRLRGLDRAEGGRAGNPCARGAAGRAGPFFPGREPRGRGATSRQPVGAGVPDDRLPRRRRGRCSGRGRARGRAAGGEDEVGARDARDRPGAGAARCRPDRPAARPPRAGRPRPGVFGLAHRGGRGPARRRRGLGRLSRLSRSPRAEGGRRAGPSRLRARRGDGARPGRPRSRRARAGGSR